ncbi:hypothetical protein OPV22_014720 [Ensete ventricosum]|uniref:Calmodulin binding protein central domain-containing protein n=1 Tax=Ensete ventricosum TaxID=4639 RepID=A0AAV8PKB0_ENSVE|nr:hypothetical protein OPV22_014720 [Ensete ventricosum]
MTLCCDASLFSSLYDYGFILSPFSLPFVLLLPSSFHSFCPDLILLRSIAENKQLGSSGGYADQDNFGMAMDDLVRKVVKVELQCMIPEPFEQILNNLRQQLESKMNEKLDHVIPQILNQIDNIMRRQADGVIAHTSQLQRSVPAEDVQPASDLQLVFTKNFLPPGFSKVAIKDKDRNLFRLGVRVSLSSYAGPRVKEAITESFLVLDHQSKLNQKSHPPSLDHEVWRLLNISSNEAFHRQLDAAGIKTVHDFLKLSVVVRQRLQDAQNMWKICRYVCLISKLYGELV